MHGEGLDVFSSGPCGVWAHLTLSHITYCFASHIKTQTDTQLHVYEDMCVCRFRTAQCSQHHYRTKHQRINERKRQSCFGSLWKCLCIAILTIVSCDKSNRAEKPLNTKREKQKREGSDDGETVPQWLSDTHEKKTKELCEVTGCRDGLLVFSLCLWMWTH